MNRLHPGETLSLWQDTSDVPTYPQLTDDIYVDVCVIGGGIAGLTTAYMLMKENKKVALIESAEIASGQTGKTTAQFCTALDSRYSELEKFHGIEGLRLIGKSHMTAIKAVKQIISDEKIECDAEEINGYLFADQDIQPELEAACRAGVDVQYLDQSPAQSLGHGPCLKFSRQLKLHPLKYISALARICTEGGVKIYTNSHVTGVNSGKIAEVKLQNGHHAHCDYLVVATNSPINDVFAIHTKQAPYRSYVMGFSIPKNSVHQALYWDTQNPLHYVRVDSSNENEDMLVVGGEDHKTGQEDYPERCFTRLETWARKKFPMISNISYKWSGQIMKPVDGIGFLGHNPLDRDNVYVITGDAGNGMTHATIGALLITDQIMGRTNPWEKIYNPSRISVRATAEFLKENANVAAQYGDWFSAKPKPDVHAFQRGEGVVFRDGLRMVAAYKNTSGTLEFMSAACPHLGGVVHWNNVEKSWDCPCHGSRFDCHGKVLEGPAVQNLKPLDDINLEISQPSKAPSLNIGLMETT